MGFIRMADLGQAMIATGGGGGGWGGGGYATQAKQATGYVMPGHRPPASSGGTRPPASYAPPVSTTVTPPSTPTSSPPPAITTTPRTPAGGVVGGGYRGGRSRRGRIGGEDIYRSAWETTTTTVTPGYVTPGLPTYVEGGADPYDMFGSSSVDEGVPEEREFVDTTGGQKAIPAGPQKVFMIEDDPTLSGVEDDPTLSDVGPAVAGPASGVDWKLWAGVFVVGVLVGSIGTAVATRRKS